MNSKAIELGPTGRRLTDTIRTLRRQRGISQTELAERMAAAGRPMGMAGISRIERGERRVDIDDLVALAESFGVTPTALLDGPPDPRDQIRAAIEGAGVGPGDAGAAATAVMATLRKLGLAGDA
jgi:transcriptional regulator with XRE-family HTH domain